MGFCECVEEDADRRRYGTVHTVQQYCGLWLWVCFGLTRVQTSNIRSYSKQYCAVYHDIRPVPRSRTKIMSRPPRAQRYLRPIYFYSCTLLLIYRTTNSIVVQDSRQRLQSTSTIAIGTELRLTVFALVLCTLVHLLLFDKREMILCTGLFILFFSRINSAVNGQRRVGSYV